MAKTCDLCGKKVQFGNKISHSKQHTARPWFPNVQPTTIEIDGKPERFHLCTRCIRTRHKLAR